MKLSIPAWALKALSIISLFGIFVCLILYLPVINKMIISILTSPEAVHFIESKILHKSINPDTLFEKMSIYEKTIISTVLLVFLVLFLLSIKNNIGKYTAKIKTFYRTVKTYRLSKTISVVTGTKTFVFFFCGALGVIFFIKTFGVLILDFTYTDWLMAGGDLSQHYLGWAMFRNSAWHFPIGLLDNIVYPFKESIIYTDSIPLFAVFFKLLSPLLPDRFQYFGLFGILIYFLQGAVSGLLVKKISGRTLYSVAASILFIFSTTMMQRIYSHTSLAAQFILLICIYACITNRRRIKAEAAVWSSLFFLAVGIHLYFVPMVLFFMLFYFLKLCLFNTCRAEWRKILITSCVSLIIMLVTMYVFGAFYSGADKTGGFGKFNSNLNTLFNPDGTSNFLKPLPLAFGEQYEGYGYLGLGVLLGVLFIIFYFTLYKQTILTKLRDKSYQKKIIPTAGILIAFALVSLSFKITFNSRILFEYYIPGIDKIFKIFRSTGRFIWPVVYIMICLVLFTLNRIFPKKMGLIILCVIIVLQYYDLKDWFNTKGSSFKTKYQWETELPSPEWASLAHNYKHIVFLKDYTRLNSFLDLAAKNNLTVNDAYLARKNTKEIEAHKQVYLEDLQKGEASPDTIYIFSDAEAAKDYSGVLDIFNLDGVSAGVWRAAVLYGGHLARPERAPSAA